MARISIEQQSVAIDEVMTTMGQIAMLDNALTFVQERQHPDRPTLDTEISEEVESLMGNVHTPDISAEQLGTLTDILVRDYGAVSAEHVMQSAVVSYVMCRRDELVTRQESHSKSLAGKRLEITPHQNNIVYRGPMGINDEYLEAQGYPPINAYETMTLVIAGKRYPGSTCTPHSFTPGRIYTRFCGYSLNGSLWDKREGRHHINHVSLVDRQGAPQVTITPA